MSALAVFNQAPSPSRRQSSIYDLDYISFSSLPKDEGVADRFLEQIQLIAGLETITGPMPDFNLQGIPAETYSRAMQRWRVDEKLDPILETLKKMQKGEPRDLVAAQSSFEPIQEWEGYVVEHDSVQFTARLLDLTGDEKVEREQATFSLEDVSEDDLDLIQTGAIFRWSVGYEKRVSGVRKKVSSIVFRRLPIWTRKEIEKSQQEAISLLDSIEWI